MASSSARVSAVRVSTDEISMARLPVPGLLVEKCAESFLGFGHGLNLCGLQGELLAKADHFCKKYGPKSAVNSATNSRQADTAGDTGRRSRSRLVFARWHRRHIVRRFDSAPHIEPPCANRADGGRLRADCRPSRPDRKRRQRYWSRRSTDGADHAATSLTAVAGSRCGVGSREGRAHSRARLARHRGFPGVRDHQQRRRDIVAGRVVGSALHQPHRPLVVVFDPRDRQRGAHQSPRSLGARQRAVLGDLPQRPYVAAGLAPPCHPGDDVKPPSPRRAIPPVGSGRRISPPAVPIGRGPHSGAWTAAAPGGRPR